MARISGLVSADREKPAAYAVATMMRHMTVAEPLVRIATGATLAVAGSGGSISAGDECVAVVDGVFYNADELEHDVDSGAARQLIAEYRRRGFVEALKRINGDFAVALFDIRSQTLWLGRDRVGAKPLYYAHTTGSFSFASRPQALRSLPFVSDDINRRYVAVFAGSHYRYIDNCPGESPFSGVSQLPAGMCLEVGTSAVRLHRYWDLDVCPDWTDDEATLAEQYRALLLDSVSCRLGSARRPIFTLSGGMDSSSVLACAVQLTGQRQHAVSSVYSDKTFDESDDIRGFVAEKVDRWHAIPIEGFDLFDTVRKMVRAHDEPVATATWLSHFLLSREVASQGHDVVFGGLGGDELNAGEYEYFVFNFADLRQRGLHADMKSEVAAWAKHHDHPIHRKNSEIAEKHLTRLTGKSDGEVLVDHERLTRYYPAIKDSFHHLQKFKPALDHPFGSWLKNRTYQDIFRETAPCCLRAEDRNCEAAGLGHADPFFDHRLIEFMFRVPGAMKIRDGVTKRLLREAMRGILPEETRTRIKKTGWNAPAHIWFSGRVMDQLRDLVHSRGFRERGIYNIPEVIRIIDEHRTIVESGVPRENHMMFLWQLVNVEMWAQEVVEHVPEMAAP